jgi:hypothetical protein
MLQMEYEVQVCLIFKVLRSAIIQTSVKTFLYLFLLTTYSSTKWPSSGAKHKHKSPRCNAEGYKKICVCVYIYIRTCKIIKR